MDEIAALQQLLAGALEQKSTVRLSERNVVELVNKLKACGLLDADLLHTLNGREYVTQKQLRQDIRNQLHRAGGRVAVVDLPALVRVDLVHCERQAAALAAEAGGETRLVEGELLTERYWDVLAAEVDEELRAAGSVALADLARRHGLSTEQITAAMSARLGSSVHGRLEGGLLYTDAHLARLSAQLRGALRATVSPCSVQELAATAFDGGAEAGASIVAALVAELVAAGAACGTLRSGGTLWTPAAHARRQRDAVAAFYSGNGLVGYDAVRRAGVATPRAWLSAQHPEGVHLESVMVAPALLEQVDAAVEEALTSASWADLGAHLPPSLSAADAAAAAARSPVVARTLGAGGALLAECCVLNAALLDAASDVARQAGRAAGAAAAARRRSAASTPPAAEADEARGTPARGGAKAARSGGGRAAKRGGGGSDSDGDDDDDWSTTPKSKGKAAKGKAAGRKPGVTPPPAEARGRGGGGNTPSSSSGGGVPSASELQQQLERAMAAVACGGNGALGGALAEYVRGAAAVAYAEAEQAMLSEGADARRRALDALAQRADSAFAQLQLLERGAELFAGDDATSALLAKHLLKTPGADVADLLLLLLLRADADAAALEAAAAAGAAGSAVLTDKQRAAHVRELPATLRAPGAALLEALAGRSVAALEAALEPLAAACGVRLKKLDKKAERALVAAHHRALQAQLAAEEAPPAALLLAVPLLYAARHNRALSLPGRALSAAVARLADQLTPDEHSLLSSFHDGVVELLQLRGGDSDDARAAAAAKLAWLAGRLPQLRALATATAADEAT